MSKLDDLLQQQETQNEKTTRRKNQPEAALQRQCVTWFRLAFPLYASLLFHARNEHAEGRSARIATDAAAGVVPGVPDLILAVASTEETVGDDGRKFFQGFYLGLGIELKNGNSNQQTISQRIFQQYWEAAGYRYEVVRTFEQFQAIVRSYILGVSADRINMLQAAKVRAYALRQDQELRRLNKITK